MVPSQSPLQVGGLAGTSLGRTEQAFRPPTRQELPNSCPELSSAPCLPLKSSLLSPLKFPQRPHMLPLILAGRLSSRKLTPSQRSLAPDKERKLIYLFSVISKLNTGPLTDSGWSTLISVLLTIPPIFIKLGVWVRFMGGGLRVCCYLFILNLD